MKYNILSSILLLFLFSSCVYQPVAYKHAQFMQFPTEVFEPKELLVIDQGEPLPEREFILYDEIEFTSRENRMSKEEMVDELMEMAEQYFPVDGIILSDMAPYEIESTFGEEHLGLMIIQAILLEEDEGYTLFDPDEIVTIDMKSLVAIPFVFTDSGILESVIKRIEIQEDLITESETYKEYDIYGHQTKSNSSSKLYEFLLKHSHHHLLLDNSPNWESRTDVNGNIRKIYKEGFVTLRTTIELDSITQQIQHIKVRDRMEEVTTHIYYTYKDNRVSNRSYVSATFGAIYETFAYDSFNKLDEIQVFIENENKTIKLDFSYYSSDEVKNKLDSNNPIPSTEYFIDDSLYED